MDDEDIIEKPECQILYRQSSNETRLSPVHLSSEEDLENETYEANPKIVDCKIKPSILKQLLPTPQPKKLSVGNNTISPEFLEELTNKISKPLEENTPPPQLSDKPNIEPKPRKLSQVNAKPNNTLKQNNQNNNFNGEETGTVEKPKVSPRKNKKMDIKDISKNENTSKPEEFRREFEINSEENEMKSDILESDEIELPENGSKYQESTEIEISVGLLKALHITKREKHECTDSGGGVNTNRKEEMATLRPKSPRPVVAPKPEKDESIWDKLGTLGRKKRIKEVQEVQAEGKYAIDSPGCATAPIIPPEDYNLDDNEERCMIVPEANDDMKFKELLNVLKEWINDELASQRIIIQDLAEDLYDGQVLQKLLEKLTGDKLDVPEVTQSEEGQKQKLEVVLDHFNQVLGIRRIMHNKWSVEAIHSKNIVAITHLLVALARHFRPPVRLPEHVSVDVVVVQKSRGQLVHKTVRESLTKAYDDVGMRCERDAFDTLFDHAPDKLQVVKKSLVTFVNKHLNKMNFEVTEIESQFHDGVYLIMLMGLLEGFFVPHYIFHLTPHEFDQKVHNVNFAFELMEEVGLQKPKARPEDPSSNEHYVADVSSTVACGSFRADQIRE